MRILLAQDADPISEILRKALEQNNHAVTVATNGADALQFAELHDFDVLVLDVGASNVDAIQITRQLRRGLNQVPVVMLAAVDATSNIVEGLDAGADDFLREPFSLEELLARLRAAVRHRPASRASHLRVEDLVMDPASHRISRNGTEIRLRRTEFRLMEFLLRRKGRVVTKAALIDGVWGLDCDVKENTLEAHIRNLRLKIDCDPNKKLIHTCRGVGYRLGDEE